jgi:hypothetical protein
MWLYRGVGALDWTPDLLATPLTILDYTSQWHCSQYLTTVHSLYSTVTYFTHSLGLLSHTIPLVPAFRGEHCPFWIPKLSCSTASLLTHSALTNSFGNCFHLSWSLLSGALSNKQLTVLVAGYVPTTVTGVGVEVEVEFVTDCQSASSSWCWAALWGPWPDFKCS